MKRFSLFALILIFPLIWISSQGCRTVATPSFPLIPTNTPTITPTFTNTPLITNTATNSPTNSPTPTISSTATDSPSPTITNTPGGPTDTATDSPTNSPSTTPTDTPTNSPTAGAATNTPTTCSAASVQTTYTFETGVDCLHPDASNTMVTGYGLSSTQKHAGSQSYALSINNTSGGNTNAQFEIAYSTPQNLSGSAITVFIYLEAGLSGSAGFQVAEQNTGCGWDSTWYNAPATGSWLQVVLNPSTAGCSGASTPSNATQLVFQLTNIPNGASGNIYIDDISITLPAGPTATPTSTATAVVGSSFYFDGGSIPAGWSLISGGSPLPVTLSGPTLEAPGYAASAGAMGATVTWNAINQNAAFQYAYGSPTNWTALGITGFRAMVMVNPLMDTGGGMQLYCQSGPGYSWENSSWNNQPSAGTWVQINWVPPFASGGSPVSVQQFGIQFATGGSGSAFNTDTIFVDSVELY